ncbi:MAG TPA: isochorismatase family protein [Candidatus Limnocylindrales bacterium]
MSRLLARDDSVLIVVDAQPGFGRVADPLSKMAIDRMAWLVGVAAALDIPVIATEEDAARNGPTEAAIRDRFPDGNPMLPKPVFGLADDPAILAAVKRTGRRTAVLVGMETDVCVAHSAIGLLDRGLRVAVVADATFSPGDMHAHGLRRIADAGATVIHAKGVYYEWIRTLEAARAFEAANPGLSEPPGFSL